MIVGCTNLATASAGLISGPRADRYVGGVDWKFNQATGDDSIGDHWFDIDYSQVSVTSTGISFTFGTDYVNAVNNPGRALGTEYGDVFFSFGPSSYDASGDTGLTGGWHGLSDNMDDVGAAGSGYAYALRVVDPTVGTFGNVELYALDGSDYEAAVLSSGEAFGDHHSGIYRERQEVRVDVDHDGNTLLASGAGWVADTVAETFTVSIELGDDFLATFGLLDDPTQISWHWTMTCANDTVEDTFTVTPAPAPEAVPEPASLLMFAALGIAVGLGIRRRRPQC